MGKTTQFFTFYIFFIFTLSVTAQCPVQYGLPTASCVPTTSSTGDIGTGIVNFVFNTINNSHNDFLNDGTQDFVCTKYTTVDAGSTYRFTANLYGTLGLPSNDEYCRVYIDYNNDGAFSAGEIVYDNMTTRQMVHTGNITIPASSILTNQMLRMRVMTDYSIFNSGCTNPEYGEVEDYGIVINNPAPTATIVVADNALRIGETSLVTITFSKAVTGFTNADLTIANGTLSALSASDVGVTWTATFTPTPGITDATNVITLANTGVADLSGNAGTGTTNSNNYTIDTQRPTATIVVADNALRIGETSLVTITFSEAVTGFTNADLTIANGTLSALSSSDGGIIWTATFTPTTASVTDATNVITLDNTGVTDASGNAGTGTTNSNNYTIDTQRPTATIVVADNALSIGETSLVTITFSEAVTGFTNADLTIANGTLSAVSTSDGGVTWTATITPNAGIINATNVITLDNTGVTDASGNAGTVTTDSNNYAIDTLIPIVASVSVPANGKYVAGDNLEFTIVFNKEVKVITAGGIPQIQITIGGIIRQANYVSGSETSSLLFKYTIQPGDLDNDGVTIGPLQANNGILSDIAGNNAILTLNNVAPTTNVLIDATITPTITFANSIKTYGDANFDLGATSNSMGTISYSVVGGTGEVILSGTTNKTVELKTVGTVILRATQVAAGDYTSATKDITLTITAKPITVTADAKTKVYGATDPSLTYSVSPSLVGTDAFTGTLTRVSGENVSTYAIEQNNLSAGSNYTITYVAKDFAITAKPITVTADVSQTKVYGTTDPSLTYSVSPSLLGTDAFIGTLSRVAGENAGTYAITQNILSAGSNYTIAYVAKDFAITAKPITVTADASQTKVYGTTDARLTYSVSPSLLGTDAFAGALSRTAGENVGQYAIAQGTLSAGANYAVTFVPANYSITKANQVITWNQTLVSDCGSSASIALTATSTSGLGISFSSSNSNVATIVNNGLVFVNPGSATITASQIGDNNYNVASSIVLPLVNSQPNLIRKQFEDVIFFDNSSNQFVAYTWYKNGVVVAGQTAQYFKETGALNGSYYAVATKKDGTVIRTCPLVLTSNGVVETMNIAPNPVRSNSSYQLITNIEAAKIQNARVTVFNTLGSLMTDKVVNESTIEMVAPSVEGIYIVKLTLSNGKMFTKNLLVRN